MTNVSVDGLKYHIVEKGSGQSLLLLHGFTGSSENWRDLIAFLGNRFRIIAVDLPGHGLTDSPEDISRYRIDSVAHDVVRILQHLDASPAHWLGYSMGGRLALYSAIHYPESVRTLTLASATAGIENQSERDARRRQDNSLADFIEREGIAAFVDYWQRLPLFDSQGSLAENVRESLREQRMQNSTQGLANSLRGMGTGEQPSVWDTLAQLKAATCLIAGQLDEKFVAINKRMANAIPNCELSIIPGAGHAVQLEQPSTFAGVVSNFLEERSGVSGENLPNSEQGHKNEGSKGHLLEPRVERRQLNNPVDSQSITQ